MDSSTAKTIVERLTEVGKTWEEPVDKNGPTVPSEETEAAGHDPTNPLSL